MLRSTISPLSAVPLILCALILAFGVCSCGDDSGAVSQSSGGGGRDGGPSLVPAKKDGGAGQPAGGGGALTHDGGTGGLMIPSGTSPDPGASMLAMMAIDECGDGNAAGLSTDQVAAVKAGGSSAGMQLLYPYDGTVFPRGIGGPQMMWNGNGNSAVYLHVTSNYLEYNGCLKSDAQGVLKFPQTAWAGIEQQTLGPKTPFSAEITVLDGDTVRGPMKFSFIVAQATLKGSLYYNTYNSALTGGSVSLGGLVLRIKPGQNAQFFTRNGECTGCHSVSANGKRMVTREVLGIADGYVFQIDTNTQPDPPPLRTATGTSFVGLSPDGAAYLTTARQGIIGPPTEGAITTVAPLNSILYDTDSGNEVTNSGFPTSAMMPSFSADGTLAAFNDFTHNDGNSVSLMDYDLSGRHASNERDVYTSTKGYLGWPFVLPDNGAVIFTTTESGAFSGGGAFVTPAALQGPNSNLWMVDIASGQATILARAMGYATPQDADANNSYLPFGAEEQNQSYYPTVSPVAAGGYFWVFFDSVRHYGNQGMRRQLWVTAVAVQHRTAQEGVDNNQPLYASDLSNPAFYMPGQDFNTANHRAFTALDPCLMDGASCESGIDCCSGFCTDGLCGPPKMCSQVGDKCTADSDCCDKADVCIGGYCGIIAL